MTSHRADPMAAAIADRHYNRQKPGTPQFVPPGRCIVLLTPDANALWISSWPKAEYVKHKWGGAWICTAFRNESSYLASELIREAIAVTRACWGDPPEIGMVTFVDAAKVRKKRDPGRCFLRSGFVSCGTSKGGLLAFRLPPERMPAAQMPLAGMLFADRDQSMTDRMPGGRR